VDTSAVRIVAEEQRLVLASLDRAQARIVPTRSGQRQQLSLGWEGHKPLDTELSYHTRGGGYSIGGLFGVILIVVLIVWLLRGGGYLSGF
jgi:hypothetical protein